MSDSEPVGPSPEYIDLLEGRINSQEYIAAMKARVDARLATALGVRQAMKEHRRGKPIAFPRHDRRPSS